MPLRLHRATSSHWTHRLSRRAQFQREEQVAAVSHGEPSIAPYLALWRRDDTEAPLARSRL